ncbi:hypothetical protein BC937DRAFT_86868 [Endogone sp. FLAS-F59071]|nr:hypothetical protein BC937DRAFT_86868 [Endogone sp. FLAS-F59071]|eukprot:RUS19810.1 hypothetical protein BC937DRAFT_86868 [Endogone sp. FLAS-F59071]
MEILLLKVASKFFEAKFSEQWNSESPFLVEDEESSQDAESISIAKDAGECKYYVKLDDKYEIELLLGFIDPANYFRFDWSNIDMMLRIGDFYEIEKITDAGFEFLESNYQDFPLKALYHAENNGLNDVYRKSSTYVIDNFYKYRECQEFEMLSERTKRKLFETRLNLIEYFFRDFNWGSCRACSNFKVGRISGSIIEGYQKLSASSTCDGSCSIGTNRSIGQSLQGILGSDAPTIDSLKKHKAFRIELD